MLSYCHRKFNKRCQSASIWFNKFSVALRYGQKSHIIGFSILIFPGSTTPPYFGLLWPHVARPLLGVMGLCFGRCAHKGLRGTPSKLEGPGPTRCKVAIVFQHAIYSYTLVLKIQYYKYSRRIKIAPLQRVGPGPSSFEGVPQRPF